MENSNPGTILLASVTQAALFEHELKGQFSDGLWENSRPHNHWRFWSRLDVQVCPAGQIPCVETWCPWAIMKRSYALTKLYETVGDRMLTIGRMARATLVAGPDWSVFAHGELRGASEYMPPTLEEWRARKANGKWRYDFIGGYMEHVTDELAQAFYAASYGMKDLCQDIEAIEAAMANVVEVPKPAPETR